MISRTESVKGGETVTGERAESGGDRIPGGVPGGPLRLLLLLFLTVTAAVVTVDRYRTAPSIDFYHYWAVGKARQVNPGLGSPYREAVQYAASVNGHAAKVQDRRLDLANRYRRSLDLTGTPLFYSLFAILPGDYEKAFGLFFTLQPFLFLISLGSLAWIFRRSILSAAALCLLLVVAYEPFFSDLRVGNVNTFQLAALTGLTAAMAILGRSSRNGPPAWLLAVLPVMILVKPNLALVGFVMGLCLALNSAWSPFRKALLLCLPLGLILLSLPCLYFRSWTVWSDWLHLVTARGGTRLVYPVAEGNFSLPAIVADLFGLPHFTATLIVLAALLLSFGTALARGRLPWLRECAADPFWAVTASTAATLTVTPLAWVHYYVLLLLPAGWLLFGRHSIPGGIYLGAAAMFLSSGLSSPLYAFLGLLSLEPGTFAAGAVSIWAAAMAALSRPGSLSAVTQVSGSGPEVSSP